MVTSGETAGAGAVQAPGLQGAAVGPNTRARASVTARLPKPAWQQALLVGIGGALLLALISSLLPREGAPRGDDLIYELMARNPLGAHTFPFAYRIGVPWLVHVMPFGHTFSFRLLDLIATGGAGAFAFLLMRRYAAPGLSAALAFAFMLSPPMLIVALRDGRNTDAATLLFMMAATYFVVERRLRLLAVTLAMGVLVREAELFIIPLAHAVWARSWWDAEAAKRVVAVGAGALAGFVALHLSIHSVGRAMVPGYGASLLGGRLAVIESGLSSFPQQARRLFTIYGPLWIAAPLAFRYMPFARRGLVLVAAALAAMTVAQDWGRMILLAAPVFYPAGAFTLTRNPRWRAPALVTFAVLIVAYAAYMGHSGVRTGIVDNPAPPYPVR